MNQEALQIAKESMRDNHRLLTALGNETPIKITYHPEESIILSMLKLLPKSTEGKLALLFVGLIAAELLTSKD